MSFDICCKAIEAAGFSRLREQNGSVNIYCCYRNERMNVVFVWNEPAIAGVSPDMLDESNKNIVAFFAGKGVFNCMLLNIICTYNTSMSKRNTKSRFPVWFVDEVTGRLIIYENQPEDFAGLRQQIEEFTDAGDISGADITGAKKRKTGKNMTRRNVYPAYINWFIIVVNIVTFVIMELDGNTSDTSYMLSHGALNVQLVLEKGEYYRIFTSMFMHAGFSHIFNNMLVLFFAGDNLERAAGHVKYFIMYIAGGLLANIAALIYYNIADINVCCVGASGAIFSVVGALFYIVLVNKGHLENLSASKLGVFIVMSIYLGLRSATTSNSAHIGGLIAGFVLAALIYKKEKSH